MAMTVFTYSISPLMAKNEAVIAFKSKTSVMKTFLIPVFLLLVINTHAQTERKPAQYAIVAKGESLIIAGKPDSAVNLAMQITRDKKSDAFEQRQAFFIQGKGLFASREPEAAIPPLRKSILLSDKTKDEYLQLKALIVLGAAYGDKYPPDNDNAISCFESGLTLAQKLKDSISIAKIFDNYSYIYVQMDDYAKAIHFNRLAGSIWNKQSGYDLDKAIHAYQTGGNVFEYYLHKDSFPLLEEAKGYFVSAIELFQKNKQRRYEAEARNALAGCLLYFVDVKNAEKEALESIKLGREEMDTTLLLNGYYTLANLYEMNAEPKSALNALDSMEFYLISQGKASEFAFMKNQFGNSDERTSIALIKGNRGMMQKLYENQMLNQKNWMLAGFSAFLFLTALGLFVYLRQKSKINKQAQRLLKKEIEYLIQSRDIEFIKARLEGEEEERHRIARQIHDGVGGLLVSTKWNLESALDELAATETSVANRLKENLKLQENSYHELRKVMYRLEKNEIPWWEQLEQFCRQLSQHKKVKIRFYHYNIDETIPEQTGNEIRLIIQELITNALKHAQATEISIQLSFIEGEVDIIVEDNGVGINKEKMVKGIGLKSIESRVKALSGTYSMENGNGTGAIAFIFIPVEPIALNERSEQFYMNGN